MYNINIDNRLENLLNNKRVAIVGPAAYLMGENKGEEIDNYDVVIRPNAFSVLPSLYKDYGSRTDIMFHNMGTAWMPGLKEQIEKNLDNFKSLKMVILSSLKATGSDAWHQWPDNYISACVDNFNQVNQFDIPYWWIGMENYKKIYNEVGCELYTGITTVLISTDCNPSELYLTGFDFYSSSKIYADGYLASVDSSQETTNRGNSHGDGCNDKNRNAIKRWYDMVEFSKVDDKIVSII
jgi:hypothetical protein